MPRIKVRPMLDTTANKITKIRQWTTQEEYESTLNLVRNTLKIETKEALHRAGYSGSTVANKWRSTGQFPLLAVNALKGLLVDHKIAQQEMNGKPLLFSIEDLIAVAGALGRDHNKLRAALFREIAKRCEE
jgi:hypothetical protein